MNNKNIDIGDIEVIMIELDADKDKDRELIEALDKMSSGDVTPEQMREMIYTQIFLVFIDHLKRRLKDSMGTDKAAERLAQITHAILNTLDNEGASVEEGIMALTFIVENIVAQIAQVKEV